MQWRWWSICSCSRAHVRIFILVRFHILYIIASLLVCVFNYNSHASTKPILQVKYEVMVKIMIILFFFMCFFLFGWEREVEHAGNNTAFFVGFSFSVFFSLFFWVQCVHSTSDQNKLWMKKSSLLQPQK